VCLSDSASTWGSLISSMSSLKLCIPPLSNSMAQKGCCWLLTCNLVTAEGSESPAKAEEGWRDSAELYEKKLNRFKQP